MLKGCAEYWIRCDEVLSPALELKEQLQNIRFEYITYNSLPVAPCAIFSYLSFSTASHLSAVGGIKFTRKYYVRKKRRMPYKYQQLLMKRHFSSKIFHPRYTDREICHPFLNLFCSKLIPVVLIFFVVAIMNKAFITILAAYKFCTKNPEFQKYSEQFCQYSTRNTRVLN